MVKKKIDSRVRALIENGVVVNQRSIFVLVGDKGKDQVVNLHYMLSKAAVKARPSVLWCYKKELGFTTHRKVIQPSTSHALQNLCLSLSTSL